MTSSDLIAFLRTSCGHVTAPRDLVGSANIPAEDTE